MSTIEAWRPVSGTPYEVSSIGRVRRGGRILKPRVHSQGYLRVCFSINAVHTDHYIHRLVCTAFHGHPPTAEHHADHIDRDRKHNAEGNLRWLSPEENRDLRIFKTGEAHHCSKLTEAGVRLIRSAPAERGSDRRLASRLGVSRETVRDVRLGKEWRHVAAT